MKQSLQLLSGLVVLCCMLGVSVHAQVGIATTDPKSTLDIRSSNSASPLATDGILIPRIDAFPAIDPLADQNGMLVFLTTTSGANPPGFYYWDHPTTQWIGIGAESEWQNGANGSGEDLIFARQAQGNGVDITFSDAGWLGLGTDDPEETLEVKKTGDNDVQITSVSPPNAPNLIFYTTGGTDFNNRDFLTDNEPIGYVTSKVWGGSSKSSDVANFSVIADGDHSSGNLPTKILLSTTPASGSLESTNGAELTIRASGSVGINNENPDDDADLDLGSSDKGLLLNRVALTATTSPAPLANHVAGMIVFNTASTGDVTPGMYYNTGTAWDRLIPETTAPKTIGIEKLETQDGTFTLVGSNFIWNSFNSGAPAFNSTTQIMAPYGSTTSRITVTPAPDGTTRDTFTCSRDIISLRVYVTLQTSSASNSRWRSHLYLNGVLTQSFWGAPPNNVVNMRTQGVFEYGPIAANTSISIAIDRNSLPASTQNQRTYFVIEYED
ncbi:hypothetical protein [Croceiramulus getboli]|nr:hypothetical protein P8624_09850 [Flavobacteriaceae bacterium YJPT1-3]